jgi:hypothetical protein
MLLQQCIHQICCSWGNEIADGLLTYRIDYNAANQKVIINEIIEEDLRNVKSLSTSQNKAIPFNEFLKPPSIIKAAFYIKEDDSQYTLRS